jgi:hypothetical protein
MRQDDSQPDGHGPLFAPLQSSHEQPQIRLLELVIDDSLDICCKLHVRPMSETFIALSYTWGEPSPTQKIWVNGHPIFVRMNLWQALDTIRKRVRESRLSVAKKKSRLNTIQKLSPLPFSTAKGSKYGKLSVPYFLGQHDQSHGPLFWIDQLCINQTDTDERNKQVRLMARIYSEACTVLIWLGTYHDAEVVEGTIACLEATNAAVAKGKPSKYWSRPTRPQFKVMEDIARNTYWTRVWIVQEIMLARKVLVQLDNVLFEFGELLPLFLRGPGNVALNQTFEYALFKNLHIEQTSLGQLLWTKSTLQDTREGKGHVTVHLLLTLLETQRCSDRRDKVYGLLGLVQAGSDREAIRADYTLSEEGVYKQVLENTIKEDFPDATRASDLCRKAGTALQVNWKDELTVQSTVDFLCRVISDDHRPRREEMITRVSGCDWSRSLDNIVAKILPGVKF